MVKTERDKNLKKGFLSFSLWGPGKKVDPTSTEDFPASPPPTPTNFDNTRTTADEEINDSSDLVQELKELGIDVNESSWKKKLKNLLELADLFDTLREKNSELVNEKERLFKENHQIRNELDKEKERTDTAISDREKRANITPEDLQNLQNEKKLVEQELSKIQEKFRKAGRTFTQTYLNNVIENATANLFTKNQLDEAVNNANNAKILAEKNLAALQTDLNNNYLKKGDINHIIAIAKSKGLIDPFNYGELAKAKLVTQSIYEVNLKTVTDQLISIKNHLITVQTDLANEIKAHNVTKGNYQNQLASLNGKIATLNTTINNVKGKLGVNNLAALPMLPVGTTDLGDLISQFGNLQVQLANAQITNTNLQGQVTSLRFQLSVDQQQIDEYSDVLKNHLGINISSPDWKKDLTDELDGKNLKDLIDGLKVSATTITDLQTKLEEERKQSERQKIFNQKLILENGRLQQEINDREVNLLKYFIKQLNLEVEFTNKEQVLAKIWELINSKPSESVVKDLKNKIQEQEEIITNYRQEENYVPFTAIRDRAAECLKDCGINSNAYQTQISQVTSFKEVTAFQQQAIKQEISRLKGEKNVTKNLNIVLCSLFFGLLMIIIYLRMKMNNSKRKVVK